MSPLSRFPHLVIPLLNPTIMLKNYLLTALRNFRRQRIFSFINILGLSVGLTCSLMIILWVQDEMSYEQFQEDKAQLYSVMRSSYYTNGEVYTWPAIPMPLAEELEKVFPEVTHALLYSFPLTQVFTKDDNAIREEGRYVDPRFFEVFSYPLLLGDAEKMLLEPNQIGLSRTMAEKLFGKDWQQQQILGTIIQLNNRLDVTITAVFEDIPRHSLIDFDYVLPVTDFYPHNDWVYDWGNNGLRMHVRLAEGTNYKELNEKVREVINEHTSGDNKIFLQPLTDRYLYNNYENGKIVGGRIEYVRIFMLVAVFLLLIAAINFMNLATARSSKRMREIGVRKVVGAGKRNLIFQFLGESVLLAIFAFFLAISFVQLLLPTFNEITFKEIELSYFSSSYLPMFLGISILVGILAGIYPAFFLSSFNITDVLKGKLKHNYGAANIRRGLVVLQFFISIVLTIGTITVYQQINFIQGKNIGIDKDHLMYFELQGRAHENYESFRQELMRIPGVEVVTAMDQFPLNVGTSTGGVEWPGKDPETSILFQIITAKHDVVKTLGLEMAEGRAFSRDFGLDTLAVLVNEAAVRAMGLENPIGTELDYWGRKRKIVGVLKDFHIASLYSTIDPALISITEDNPQLLFAKIDRNQSGEIVDAVEALHKSFNPGYPISYRFLDESYERIYQSEASLGKLTTYFALIAIFISCLGLFGLASYTADRRTKELGIRKVLGATAYQLVVLLSREFTWLVVISFTLAIPVSLYFLRGWLEQFAYHTDLGISTFIIAAVIAMGIAWFTVGIQAYRAALSNPVESLRAE